LGDIIRFQDKFYVLASSSLADNLTRILKFGETFGVFNRYGDIETVGQHFLSPQEYRPGSQCGC